MKAPDLEAIEYATYCCERTVHALIWDGRFVGLSANDVAHVIVETADERGDSLDHAIVLRIVRGILGAIGEALDEAEPGERDFDPDGDR